MRVTLLGYTETWHTNWYSWNRFADVFRSLGLPVEWTAQPEPSSDPRIWICWRDPTAEALYATGLVKAEDIVFQKLHPFLDETTIDYGADVMGFLRAWHWPIYQSFERLVEAGRTVYGFGCRTHSAEFPEKARIVTKLQDRIFWMPYGPVHFNQDMLAQAIPVVDDFRYDIGYVGSRWGRPGFGNLEALERYLDPLLPGRVAVVAGHFGTPYGQVSETQQTDILTHSRLCPIVHAPFWQAEQGVQDRFWTTFALGRFGVVDNEGVYDFFDPAEVVCAVDAAEYLDRSRYYLDHPEQQVPYIAAIQARIKTEYNFYHSWQTVLRRLKLI